MSIIIDKTYSIRYPFVKDSYFDFSCEEDTLKIGWRPGVNCRKDDDYHGEFYAEGEGLMLLTVVSIHKPGKYPERVFYTKSWVSPDGVKFGKPGLKITTFAAFKNQIKGYRYPDIFDSIEGE